MAEVQKILGQVNPGATTLTDLYTVPDNTSTTVSSLVACNQTTAGTFRVAVRRRGEPVEARHYLYYDTSISQNGSTAIIVGMTLSAGDIVSVYASSANQSFTLFGIEVS